MSPKIFRCSCGPEIEVRAVILPLSGQPWRLLIRVSCMVAALALVWPAAATGRRGADGPDDPLTSTRVVRTGGNVTSVLGVAWQADSSPIPYARLRLRNTLTGRIAAHTIANDDGRFSFTSVEPGSYLIELVSEGGKILALGHAFTIAPGETLATFVRLGTRVPWFAGFFSNAAAAVASSAAAAGVTAVAPDAMRPVSPTQ
jgi:hypothetical protein